MLCSQRREELCIPLSGRGKGNFWEVSLGCKGFFFVAGGGVDRFLNERNNAIRGVIALGWTAWDIPSLLVMIFPLFR